MTRNVGVSYVEIQDLLLEEVNCDSVIVIDCDKYLFPIHGNHGTNMGTSCFCAEKARVLEHSNTINEETLTGTRTVAGKSNVTVAIKKSTYPEKVEEIFADETTCKHLT